MVSKDATIANVKECMRELQKAFKETTTASWNKKVATLGPMDKVPEKNRFYDKESRDEYNNRLFYLQTEAMKQVDKYVDSIRNEVSEAPSEESLRALQVFSMLPAETLPAGTDYMRRVNALADKYGDNPMFMETLKGIAAKNGLQIKSHPIMRKYDEAEILQKNVKSFFDSSCALDASGNSAPDLSDARLAWQFCDAANEFCYGDSED